MSSEAVALGAPPLVREPAPTGPPAISVRGLSKVYRIYDRPADRLKQILRRGGRHYGREVWALNDVSFEVRRGETVGLIGRNGSGKSTLLQVIAGTLAPSAGEVEVNGRVAALLELGSGFNPEFSGRENVLLNGAVLGLSREDMEQRFDSIAAFADIGDFIEQPVKLYSSGMLVRLAFAVQAHIDPEVLIVDEALAVGDMYFQTKCMARIAELRRRGTSILLVTHSLGTVKALCSRAVLLDGGRLVAEGHPDPVCDRYVSMVMSGSRPASVETDAPPAPALLPERSALQPPFAERLTERFGTGAARYVDCQVFQDGREVASVVHGRECEVHALLRFERDVDEPGEVGVVVRTLDGLDLFAANSWLQGRTFAAQPKGRLVRLVFRFRVVLAPGIYTVTLGYRVPVQGEYVDKAFNALAFTVDPADERPVPFLFSLPSEFSYATVEPRADG